MDHGVEKKLSQQVSGLHGQLESLETFGKTAVHFPADEG